MLVNTSSLQRMEWRQHNQWEIAALCQENRIVCEWPCKGGLFAPGNGATEKLDTKQGIA